MRKKMKLTDVVIVASVQHTGTWFTIDFLQNFIPNKKEVAHMIEEKIQIESPTIIHSHLPIIYDLDMRVDMDWHSRRKLTMKDRSISLRTLEVLMNLFKVVIPVRDPLASILSREARHPDLRHFFIVDGFIELAQKYKDHPNVVFLPIDLPWDRSQRMKKLFEIMEHCSIDIESNRDLVRKFASNWEPKNTTPGNRFKELYKNKDIDQIRFLLGPKWAEVNYLQNMASIILPFLASVGYTRGDIGPW